MATRKPAITIVGPGNLGSAMARALRAAGYRIDEVIHRGGHSGQRARAVARVAGARATHLRDARLAAEIIWVCVGDAAIAACAGELAKREAWKGKIALHSSGALSSGELKPLRDRGAAVASIHPMMTFVRNVQPELSGVTFAIEGDAPAVRAAASIARALGARPVVIAPASKPLYHAFGAFTSPLIVATLAAAEQVAIRAGLDKSSARAALAPILQQTVRNYLARGAADAFSGPLVRGDVETIRRHLRALRAAPEARQAYLALVKVALKALPVKNRRQISALLH